MYNLQPQHAAAAVCGQPSHRPFSIASAQHAAVGARGPRSNRKSRRESQDPTQPVVAHATHGEPSSCCNAPPDSGGPEFMATWPCFCVAAFCSS
eukprot:1076395-Pleurochrysis_carterae.AAC.1